jgi:hypothetical protein
MKERDSYKSTHFLEKKKTKLFILRHLAGTLKKYIKCTKKILSLEEY